MRFKWPTAWANTATTSTTIARAVPELAMKYRRRVRHHHLGALSRYMHYPTLRYVPSREACFLCSEAKISLLEIEEVGFVEAINCVEHRWANHHRCTRYPINGLRLRAHLDRDYPTSQNTRCKPELKSAFDLAQDRWEAKRYRPITTIEIFETASDNTNIGARLKEAHQRQ